MTDEEFAEHVQQVWNVLPKGDAHLAMSILGCVCHEIASQVEEHAPGSVERWIGALREQFDKDSA